MPALFAAEVALIAPEAITASFRPVELRPYHLEQVEVRDNGTTRNRFTAHRTLVFEREGDGWRATVTLERLANDAAPAIAAVHERALAPLLGRPIVYHLDAAGSVRSIDDEAALWRSFTAAIGTAVPAGSATVADGLDQPRFRALLASIVATVVAGPDADAAIGTRAVTLPAQRLFGHAVALAGTRQVAHEHGLLAIATDAAGTLDDPAATVAVHLVRHLDPARGLLVDSTRTTRTTLGSGPAARTLVSTTSYVVAAPVS